MVRNVDYYMTPVSPWTYLGHDRFVTLCAKHGAAINVRPVDLGKIFPISGGLPLKQRAPQRQAYRLVELARWREHLGIPLVVQPKYAAAGADLASRWIIAASESAVDAALAFAGAVMRARCAEERDIADPEVLGQCAVASRLDPGTIAARAGTAEVGVRYEAFTQQAIAAQVFGAPWYVVDGEPFWGQDRLDFVARKLAQ